MRSNPELWKRGVELLKGSEFMRAVDSIPTYQQYRKDGNLAKFYEEVMANAIGKHGANLFTQKSKQNAWNKWMRDFGNWIKSALGIQSDKPYGDLTLNEWLDTAVHGVFTGTTPTFQEKGAEFSLEESTNPENDYNLDSDVIAAKIAGKRKDWREFKTPLGKLKIPRKFTDLLVPPAADDYHGLVSKIKNIPGVNKVTQAFIDNHHSYVNKSTDFRDRVKSLRKGVKDILNDTAVTHKGNELNGAQAIQAYVDGERSAELDKFVSNPKVKAYMDGMQNEGALKPSEGNRDYTMASPDFDTVNHIVNDLYKETFEDFNAKKNEVFTPEVMNRIRREKGNRYADALEAALQRMSTGKSSRGVADPTTQKWNDWAQGSVGTIMFLNFRSAALQLLSVGNYGFSDKVNSGKFIANLAKQFATLPFDLANKNSGLRKRLDSKYLRERRARAGFDVNMAELADSIQGSKNFGEITKKILNFGFKATAAIDSLAIAMGGEAFVKSGGTESNWIEQSEEAQQSSRPDRVSKWQTTGISKFVLAFANTPAQYFRLGQKALRTIRDPKASIKEKIGASSRVLWYMAAQNAIFTALQSASNGLFDEDEEEVEAAYNSMADSLLRGMGLYGAVISSLKNVAYEANKQNKKVNPDYTAAALKATSISPPLNKKINDLLAIGRGYKYGDDQKHVTAVAKGIAVTTNLPADWAQKKYNAAKELWDDEYGNWQKFLMVLGYSPYALDKKNESEFDLDVDLDIDLDDIDLEDIDF